MGMNYFLAELLGKDRFDLARTHYAMQQMSWVVFGRLQLAKPFNAKEKRPYTRQSNGATCKYTLQKISLESVIAVAASVSLATIPSETSSSARQRRHFHNHWHFERPNQPTLPPPSATPSPQSFRPMWW
jgi:hypothetical protein